LDRARFPVNDSPAFETTVAQEPDAAVKVIVMPGAVPAVIVTGAPKSTVQVCPPHVSVRVFAWVLEVPVLSANRVLPAAVPVALWTMVACAMVTLAVLVNDPNRPKTNPAMAMAAMRVMAMRMTVASTGEMAFLFFLRTFWKFIVNLVSLGRTDKSRMEFPSSFRSKI
jgi:hypothetical protein